MAASAIIRKNAASRTRGENPAAPAPASVAPKKRQKPIKSFASMIGFVCQCQRKISPGRLLVGEDLQIIGRRPHTTRRAIQLVFHHGIAMGTNDSRPQSSAENTATRTVFAEDSRGRIRTDRTAIAAVATR